jgi:hypothetical protein
MSKGASRKHDYVAMGRDFDAGMTKAEIARKYGCNFHTAYLAVSRRDLPKPAHQDEISVILTASFRKVMGYCPLADGPQGEVAL